MAIAAGPSIKPWILFPAIVFAVKVLKIYFRTLPFVSEKIIFSSESNANNVGLDKLAFLNGPSLNP